MCLLYLLNGKYIRDAAHHLRLRYRAMGGPAEGAEAGHRLLHDAGLDPAINKLHWFLCGFEGAVLARNSDLFPDPGPGGARRSPTSGSP